MPDLIRHPAIFGRGKRRSGTPDQVRGDEVGGWTKAVGLVAMQRENWSGYAQRTDLSDEAREYVVWDLMHFTSEVMKGNVS
ncbi:MAG: hypothetical protein AAFP79_04305 [Pseudomonadota bacterium]